MLSLFFLSALLLVMPALPAFAQDCCNCAPNATDQQCFMECGALLPRCQSPAPQAPRAQQSAQPQACNVAFTSFCCGENMHFQSVEHTNSLTRRTLLLCPGAPCWGLVRNGVTGPHWVHGTACY